MPRRGRLLLSTVFVYKIRMLWMIAKSWIGKKKGLYGISGMNARGHNSQFNGARLQDAFAKHLTCRLGQRTQKGTGNLNISRGNVFSC